MEGFNVKKGFIAILSSIAGATARAGVAVKMASQKTKQQKEYADKHLALYHTGRLNIM